MSTTNTPPGRKRAAPRKQAAAESPRVDEGAAGEHQDSAPSENERLAATPPAEHDTGHAIEKTLEALSVDHQTAERIQKLPHDVGWLLVTAGVVGVVMPGVLGVPFLALGGLILWPGTHRRAEGWLSGHSPKIFKGSIRQINRFLDDLEKRYPRNETSRIK